MLRGVKACWLLYIHLHGHRGGCMRWIAKAKRNREAPGVPAVLGGPNVLGSGCGIGSVCAL
jgi:hypothetical protein